MEFPSVDNLILDKTWNVRYVVKAYRKLSYHELVQAVRVAVSGMKRKPKRNSSITIISIIGYSE